MSHGKRKKSCSIFDDWFCTGIIPFSVILYTIKWKDGDDRYDGKEKKVGVHHGKTKAWKKAIVKIDTNPAEEKYITKGGKEVKLTKKYKTEIEEINSTISSAK